MVGNICSWKFEARFANRVSLGVAEDNRLLIWGKPQTIRKGLL